jgi:2'-5' RNA ligase
MTLRVDRFLVFPGQGPARVLAANVAGDSAALKRLFARIEPTVQPLGIGREPKEYKPHVTLARFRRPSLRLTAMRLLRLVDPGLLPTPSFTAETFSLIQSTLAPGGPVYQTMAEFGTRRG